MQLEQWDPSIEAAYLAIAKGIPVILVESETLRYLGGIGGLLHYPTDSENSQVVGEARRKTLGLAA